MTTNTCDGHIAALAEWIEKNYSGKNLVAMIATSDARESSASKIMGTYRPSTEFQKLFSGFIGGSRDNERQRLSAVREALGCLARGKYEARVNTYVASLSSRVVFSTQPNKKQGAVAHV